MSAAWTVEYNHNNPNNEGQAQRIMDDQGHVVAALGWSAFTVAETNANARLIAAAPDLLEAVRFMVRAADADAQVLPGSAYYRIALAAIAKAEVEAAPARATEAGA